MVLGRWGESWLWCACRAPGVRRPSSVILNEGKDLVRPRTALQSEILRFAQNDGERMACLRGKRSARRYAARSPRSGRQEDSPGWNEAEPWDHAPQQESPGRGDGTCAAPRLKPAASGGTATPESAAVRELVLQHCRFTPDSLRERAAGAVVVSGHAVASTPQY